MIKAIHLNKNKIIFLLLLTFFLACKNNASQEVAITNSAVSSGKPQASQAGLSMLEMGGNAVDAAVATAFALSVVEPSMSGIGGRMQAIIRLESGDIIGIDGTTQVPKGYNVDEVPTSMDGYHVIGIPGVVAGLCSMQEKYGLLDLKTVMQPAIELAESGFPMGTIESGMHQAVIDELVKFQGTREHFLKEDRSPYEEGELFVQPELAETLTLIAEGGKDAFYKGEIAKKMVEDNQKNGGVLALEDFENYEIRSSKVLSSSYRGFDIYGLWLPSFGAITLETMNILENLPMAESSDTDWIKSIYKAMLLGYMDRPEQSKHDSVAAYLISKDYAKKQSAALLKEMDSPESDLENTGHTTNLVTTDKNGMMVVLTQSLGPIMGSKVATPGLGFMHATASGRYLRAYEPGMRTNSHISPMIIEKDGKPFLGIGAAGGSRIVTAIVNVTSRVIDQQLPIHEALLAPRVYPAMDSIHLETGTVKGWSPEIISALKNEGIPVTTKYDPTHFGIVHAIILDTLTGKWIPAAEPDWDGAGKPFQ